ncbi:MAG: hypothetical protein J0H46_13215 [Bacteroidetes bacterium]|nr:hypothetical protein [Bacteroidota bacterium]
MKNILFLIILLCIAASSFAQSYRYNTVIIAEKGGDGFGFSNQVTKKRSGTILVKQDRISVDFKKYKLKKQIGDNLYRTNGGTVQCIYDATDLVAVQINKFNVAYYYQIKANDIVAVNKP